jgi:hypothetical protein
MKRLPEYLLIGACVLLLILITMWLCKVAQPNPKILSQHPCVVVAENGFDEAQKLDTIIVSGVLLPEYKLQKYQSYKVYHYGTLVMKVE